MHRWFDLGAAAVERTVRFDDEPDRRRVYACPQCFSLHPRTSIEAGKLTEEHVPPRSIGGRPLVLTCAACNHGAGQAIDGDAAGQARAKDFLALRRGESRVRLGGDINALLQVPEPGSLELVASRNQNHPATFAAFDSQLRRWLGSSRVADTPPSFELQLPPPTFDNWRANLSYLRAAYLTAFAVYGYRLVLGRSFGPIRRQLRDLDRPIIKRLVVGDTFPDDAPKSFLAVGRAQEIGYLLVVRFANRWVGLPPSEADTGWWERAAAAPLRTPMWVRSPEPFPQKPLQRMDFEDYADGGTWLPIQGVGEVRDEAS